LSSTPFSQGSRWAPLTPPHVFRFPRMPLLVFEQIEIMLSVHLQLPNQLTVHSVQRTLLSGCSCGLVFLVSLWWPPHCCGSSYAQSQLGMSERDQCTVENSWTQSHC
jgi:hypothetical protein